MSYHCVVLVDCFHFLGGQPQHLGTPQILPKKSQKLQQLHGNAKTKEYICFLPVFSNKYIYTGNNYWKHAPNAFHYLCVATLNLMSSVYKSNCIVQVPKTESGNFHLSCDLQSLGLEDFMNFQFVNTNFLL